MKKIPRYWEHGSISLNINEARALLGVVCLMDTTFISDLQTVRAKLSDAIARMAPNKDVCATCRHHRLHHTQQTWFLAGQICSGNWPEQGPCRCRRFRGQRP